MELLMQILCRLVELNDENQQLRKEVSSRRHQADKWRKRSQALEVGLKAQAKRTKFEEKAIEEAHINEFMKEGETH
jgi:hypothetical protein